jgi:DMSO/TMAO reductase YedYZ heme-binding membrane subunit
MSTYRPSAIAAGSVAMYALVITAVTAKWTRLLPSGWWLRIHRFTVVAFLLAWAHAVLAGSDGGALTPLYLVTGAAVLALGVARWWSAKVRPQRPASPVTAASTRGRPEPVAVPEETR